VQFALIPYSTKQREITSYSNLNFQFDNSYARSLPGFYTKGEAEKSPAPTLIKLNTQLAEELRLDPQQLDPETAAQIFSGNQPPDDAEVLAQAYAGHQFGNFVPQLGDGRAVLLGEVIDIHGNRRDIQLKGSGRTPFSRGGDGKAAVGPVLREYIIGEAMHALGIPTTRALAAVSTGQKIFRDNILPGAILTRVASSHIRVGTFQFFAARRDTAKIKQLADYTIARHYPHITTYQDFLKAVCDRQASLIAQWMHVGFIHGVMNTDNMAISGETIDYGPCAFMDYYDPETVFSSIDRQGRYAYGQQPLIARWNLTRFAETLLPLGISVEEATTIINNFTDQYDHYWLTAMRRKLGISHSTDPSDMQLANLFLSTIHQLQLDYTNAFHTLQTDPGTFGAFATEWQKHRINHDEMKQANPIYIPRNHLVEAALTAATNNDLAPFNTLLEVITQPFTHQPGRDEYTQPAPRSAPPYRTFCGT